MIRRATSSDHPWIRGLAAEVYRDLGDYWTIIGSWLEHPGVLTYLDEVEDAGAPRPRGFILVGFYQPPGSPPTTCFADLLAIAVAPGDRRLGLGRELLEFAIGLAGLPGDGRRSVEIRLTVAESNAAGQALFGASGFTALDEDHGTYEGGQRAIRMTRPISSP